MSTTSPVESPNFRHVPLERLRHILSAYLVNADPLRWPGADGMTEEDVLIHYPDMARRGCVPDRRELGTLFPELEEPIARFFDSEL